MQRNKKGLEITASMLTKLLYVLFGAFILFGVIIIIFSDSSDIDSAIAVCRSSVDAREFAARQSLGTSRSAVPMLCKTIDLQIPEKQYLEIARTNFTKAVMMNIADRSMDCWYMFGDGVYDRNVFSGWGFFRKNQCFTCFTFTISDHDNYESIYISKFNDFIMEEPYRPIPQHAPLCLFDDEDQEGCVSRDAPECERKGGFCLEENILNLVEYEGWSCDSRRKKCYISDVMLETYMDYMYNRAHGVFTLGTSLLGLTEQDIERESEIRNIHDIGFNKDKTYGIAFISHTRDIGITATVGIVGGTLMVVTAGKAGVVALGVKKLLLGTTTAAVAGAEAHRTILNEFNLRKPPTLFLSELGDIDNKCTVVDDFNQ